MQEAQYRPALDEQFLRPLHEVNGRCIELLYQLAAAPATGEPAPFSIAHELRAELRSLDPMSRRRAAQCPFLLVDFEFRNQPWWRDARWHAARSADDRQRRTLARKWALPLARATLVLAWHCTRAHPQSARIALGLPASVGEAISGLTLDEIEHLAERHFQRLRPRWQDRAGTWRTLLRAAREDDPVTIREFRLHGIQLLGSELQAP